VTLVLRHIPGDPEITDDWGPTSAVVMILVPVRFFVAYDRIAVRTADCLVFNDVLPAASGTSCKVNASSRPASPEFAIVKTRVFQG
jgi:hypothetical protein